MYLCIMHLDIRAQQTMHNIFQFIYNICGIYMSIAQAIAFKIDKMT